MKDDKDEEEDNDDDEDKYSENFSAEKEELSHTN